MVRAERPHDPTAFPRILFAGGGTLGHLMPGVTVAEEILRRWPQADLLFVTSANPQTAQHVRRALEARRLRSATVDLARLKGAGAFAPRSLRALPALAGGLLGALRLLQRFRPHLVVGLGGYASVPAVLAANILGVPTVLLEQNARVGKANRLLARWADIVCCAWPGGEEALAHPERVRYTGNPVRRAIAACARPGGADAFGPRVDARAPKKTLLVMGGSNGAAGINALVVRCLPAFEAEREWLRILHCTGSPHYEEVLAAYRGRRIEVMVVPFLEDMAIAYRASDLVVCRAGGTTLAEVCAAGRAAVIIPFPYAAEDHQRRNAEVLAAAGAAVVMDEAQAAPEDLCREVLAILRDDARRRRMASRALSLSRAGAASYVVEQMEELMQPSGAPDVAPMRS